MATYTTNLDLKKPAQNDKIRIADINNNMDDIDAAFGAVGNTSVATQMSDIRAGMAIVAVSNTHAAIASGEYVYVTGHDTLDDGLYKASSAIAANGTLSSSNLTAVSKGGLNALNDQIGNLIKTTGTITLTVASSGSAEIPTNKIDPSSHLPIFGKTNGWCMTFFEYANKYFTKVWTVTSSGISIYTGGDINVEIFYVNK